MPQLTSPGSSLQFFWLFLTFTVLYVILSRWVLHRRRTSLMNVSTGSPPISIWRRGLESPGGESQAGNTPRAGGCSRPCTVCVQRSRAGTEIEYDSATRAMDGRSCGHAGRAQENRSAEEKTCLMRWYRPPRKSPT